MVLDQIKGQELPLLVALVCILFGVFIALRYVLRAGAGAAPVKKQAAATKAAPASTASTATRDTDNEDEDDDDDDDDAAKRMRRSRRKA